MPGGTLRRASHILVAPLYLCRHVRSVEDDAGTLANVFPVDALQGIRRPLVHPDDCGAYCVALPVNTDAAVKLPADCETGNIAGLALRVVDCCSNRGLQGV